MYKRNTHLRNCAVSCCLKYSNRRSARSRTALIVKSRPLTVTRTLRMSAHRSGAAKGLRPTISRSRQRSSVTLNRFLEDAGIVPSEGAAILLKRGLVARMQNTAPCASFIACKVAVRATFTNMCPRKHHLKRLRRERNMLSQPAHSDNYAQSLSEPRMRSGDSAFPRAERT